METTQAYQSSSTTGITVQSRDAGSENYASWPMEQKLTAKGGGPTAIVAADTVAVLNGAPYTDSGRLWDVGHSPFFVLSAEFDAAADRSASVQVVFYDASNNVIGAAATIQFGTQKLGNTVLLAETAGHALGGVSDPIDVRGACRVGVIVHALSGGSLYLYGWAV